MSRESGADARFFDDAFHALTGKLPLRWQKRLFQEHFVKNEIPPVIDLPTGLGKTMVIAIWLIARGRNAALPRRLIYVVDRRTVVDQATDLAELLQRNVPSSLASLSNLAISTLRGQLADNREWSRDLSRPAIVIGTVDLIGSALLFSGYRSSYKRRPMEAGLLGQDSLLVLDEAHLSKPFEDLVKSIERDGPFQKDREGKPHGAPMKVVRMSATSGNAKEEHVFRLDTDPNSEAFDLWSDRDENGKEKNPVKQRFGAKKRLTITTISEKDDLKTKLADAAVELAQSPRLVGKRIVVFVRKPDDEKAVARAVRDHVAESVDDSGPKPKKIKNTPYASDVELLTGTLRGLERDKLVERPVFKERWLNGDLKPDDPANQGPVLLVCTSAGEVGFDLNADHMVCDAAPLDSMIQRLGRVNRRGMGTAIVQVFVEPPSGKKKEAEAGKHTIDSASANAIEALKQLPEAVPLDADTRSGKIYDTSSLALSRLAKPDNALSPKPPIVELTDILLDAWSLTSITEPMPGRPEVGPWLRGIADEQAQTTVAWRAEIELLGGHPTPEKALRDIFARHPIRPHESLTVNTAHLLEFLKQIAKLKDRPSDPTSMRVAVRLPSGQVVCRTFQQLADKPRILYTDSTLILPARFGGLNNSGMLDAESIPTTRSDGDSEPSSLDVADHIGYEQTDAARSRLRVLIKRTQDGSWRPEPLPGGAPIPDKLKLKSDYDKSTSLFNDLKAADFRVRLVQPIRRDEEGEPVESLVILSPAPAKKNRVFSRIRG
jgi:CRISPR-associated endonuclease/helicase Cas3